MNNPAPSVLAVIPARGGSKGIPGKNVAPVGGIPLVSRSVRAARAARSVTRCVVSTDDDAIARAALAAGAGIVRRPTEISGDTASSESALLHALESLAAQDGFRPDVLVFLQCTSPFTRADDIDRVVTLLLSAPADSVFTACPFHFFLWRRGSTGNALPVNHEASQRLPRQQREPEFMENGAVYAMRVPGFLAARHRFFGKTAICEMPPARSLEIDEPADLLLANNLAATLDHE